MVAITNYTDTDAIRHAIGVTANEVPDAMLTGMKLEDRLESDLYEWLTSHATDYPTWTAVGASAAHQQNARNLRLYATYFCAAEVVAFQLAIPSMVGDGKNQLRRFEGVDFEQLAAYLADQAAKYRQLLDEAVNGTAQLSLTLLGRAVPDYDPVTNS